MLQAVLDGGERVAEPVKCWNWEASTEILGHVGE